MLCAWHRFARIAANTTACNRVVSAQSRPGPAENKERKLNALLDATNIIYIVGYFHLSPERPLAVLIPDSGEPVMLSQARD
jgi:hypothetical protein